MRYTITLAMASLLAAGAAGAAVAEVPRVITDIPPVQSLVAQVMGDLGTPGVLLEQGANAHSFQLRPSQAAELAEAGLVVWVGPELTPWLARALEGVESGPTLGLLAAEGTALRAFEESGHLAEDPADEDHAAEGHDHAAEGDGHSHEGADPHAWLDPGNASLWLGVIAAKLGKLDPEHAAVYAANAAAAQTGVAALDAEVAGILAPVKGKPIVVFHDAYGYFAAHYGLTVAATVALGDAASPGAAHLREVQAELGTGGMLCIFPEANHDPKLVTAMVEGTSARIGAALDPEGSALAVGPGLYRDLMLGMARGIADCMAGG